MRRGRAVAIVIKNQSLLVMFRQENGKEYYTLPGGGIESGETAEKATIREVQEETSIEVKIKHQVYEQHYDDGSKQYFYLCQYISGKPELSPTAPEQQDEKGSIHKPMWLSFNKLQKTLLYPLEIRDWIIEDLQTGFPNKIRQAEISISQLRRTL